MPHTFEFCTCNPEDYSRIVQLNLWKNAPDLETLFNLNKLYILGQLTVHPAHGIPLYAESAALKRKLVEMNEHGLFTIQGQPRTVPGEEERRRPHAHTDGKDDKTALPEPTDTRAWCCCCAGMMGCWAECDKFSARRQLPYVQFCVAVEDDTPGAITAVKAAKLAEALCRDPRVHTMVSWPRVLELLYTPIDRWCAPWTAADLTEARKYVPEQDLELYRHFKSRHGSSRVHEIHATAAPGKLAEAKWRYVSDRWSQVNDYHLLRPRVPGFFIGPGAKTVVFVVNATRYKDGVEDVEKLILEKAEAAGFKKRYLTLREGSVEEHAADWTSGTSEPLTEEEQGE